MLKKIRGESHCEEHKDRYRANRFVSEQNEAPAPIDGIKCLELKESLVSTDRCVHLSAFELSGLQTPLEDSLKRPWLCY